MSYRLDKSTFIFDLYFENEMLMLEINKSFLDLNLIYIGYVKMLQDLYTNLGDYKQDKESFGFADVFIKIKEDEESVYFGTKDFSKDRCDIIVLSLYIFLITTRIVHYSKKQEYKIQSKKLQEFYIEICVRTSKEFQMGAYGISGICSNENFKKILTFEREQTQQIKNTMLTVYKSWHGTNPEYENYSVDVHSNHINIATNAGKGTWITIGSIDGKTGEISGQNIDSSIEELLLLSGFAQVRTLLK